MEWQELAAGCHIEALESQRDLLSAAGVVVVLSALLLIRPALPHQRGTSIPASSDVAACADFRPTMLQNGQGVLTVADLRAHLQEVYAVAGDASTPVKTAAAGMLRLITNVQPDWPTDLMGRDPDVAAMTRDCGAFG